jgi:histidine triad (HIT) family protein
MSFSIRRSLNNVINQLVGTRPGLRITAWIFSKMSFGIPNQRIVETETLLAFFHPDPAYEFHVVFVPKRPIANLLELDASDNKFLQDLFERTKDVVSRYQLEKSGYRLILNGGPYQDFPYLHFHLISGPSKDDERIVK